jgi:hypothetical protein
MNDISPDDIDDVMELSKQIYDSVNQILDSNNIKVCEAALTLAVANLITPLCDAYEGNLLRLINAIVVMVGKNLAEIKK